MFTINIYVKFAIIGICLIGGIILSFVLGIGYTWIFIIIGLLFLASYLFLGTVQSASELLQAMDFILKGSLAAQRKDNTAAEGYFNAALALNLPSDNEKGMILLQMAGIQAQKNNWTGAKNYFYQAKNLKITEPQL